MRTLKHAQQQKRHKNQGCTGIGRAPMAEGRDAHHEGGCCCPTQIACQPVGAERMPQALFRNPVVQNGEVDGVKSAIAQTKQNGRAHQPTIALNLGHAGAGQSQHRQGRIQHRASPKVVNKKSRQGLADPRDHKENRHQQTQLGITQAKVLHESWEHQGQQQVRKMRAGMNQAHQAHHLGILPPGHHVGGFKRA